VISTVARQRPLLLVIEDLHWAGRSTRDFLAFLVRNARREPVARDMANGASSKRGWRESPRNLRGL
jgi:predicted ATPase